ncbi:MAG: hypothetical protein ACLQEQ_02680 [Nitrososphaerales archaeon]
MTGRYHVPQVNDSQVMPTFVRDQLLLCFESANREFAAALRQPVTDDQLKQQVRSFVELVFSQCGASYVSPTRAGIVETISECKNNAEKMMGSQGSGIIRHHYAEMMKLADKLQS